MKKISRLLAALTSLTLPLFLAVLLPILMTGTATAQSLLITNGTSTNFSAGTNSYSGIYVGFTNRVTNGNNLTVVNTNTLVTNSGVLVVGASGRSNSMVISNGGTVRNATAIIGSNAVSSNNAVLVTGGSSLWTNSGSITVGSGGSGNSLVISNGGKVASLLAYIGSTGASNNSVLVTGTGSLWTNSVSSITNIVYVGYYGAGSSLTVADGGTVVASGIGIGTFSLSGSTPASGTLNIGRFGTNDTAGSIIAPTITFGTTNTNQFVGSGIGGAINFNQSDATTITSVISGVGAINQLGAGTTTLTGSNSYTGTTTISAGTLLFSNATSLYRGSNANWTAANIIVASNATVAFGVGGASSFTTSNVTTLLGNLTTVNNNGLRAGSSIGFDTTAGNFTLTNKITNSSGTGGGSLGLTKLGSGTLTLSASNSFTGPLSVKAGILALSSATGSAAGSASTVSVSSGATLLISQNNQVNNGGSVTLSGGTITRGSGVSETFGNLNLTAPSFLDFGTGTAGNLTFGTYAPSALLTINNFGLGNTLVFGSDLTSTINNSSFFTFTNGGIGSSSWNEGTSTFTITAIPEPSTYVAAIALLAMMLWPLRHRLRAKVS